MASLDQVREALAAADESIIENDAITNALAGLDWADNPTETMFAQSDIDDAVTAATAELRARWWAGKGADNEIDVAPTPVTEPTIPEEVTLDDLRNISNEDIFG